MRHVGNRCGTAAHRRAGGRGRCAGGEQDVRASVCVRVAERNRDQSVGPHLYIGKPGGCIGSADKHRRGAYQRGRTRRQHHCISLGVEVELDDHHVDIARTDAGGVKPLVHRGRAMPQHSLKHSIIQLFCRTFSGGLRPSYLCRVRRRDSAGANASRPGPRTAGREATGSAVNRGPRRR